MMRRVLLILSLVLACSRLTWAAVAFDACTTVSYEGATSVTWADHAAGGSNRVALGQIANTPSTSISSVTWGGSAMTSVVTQVEATYDLRASIYRYVAPSTSGQAMVATFAAATYGAGGACSYTGVDQTTPITSSNGADGDSDTASVVITSATDELVADVVSFYENVGFPNQVPGTNQTERFEVSDSFGDGSAASTEAGAASVTMSWALNLPLADQHWAQVGAALKASSGTVATPKRLLTLGAG